MSEVIGGGNKNPMGRDPKKMGRKEVADSSTETIDSGKYAGGQDRMGTNSANVHGRDRRGYNDASSEQHRAGERSAPPQKR